MKWIIIELSSLLLMAGCATGIGGQTSDTVRGVASYRERIAVPPGTQLEVKLEDVSRADAPSVTIANTSIPNAGQPPYQFELPYHASQIIASHRYTVRASLTHQGQLLFTTDQLYPVITSGNPNEVNLLLKPIKVLPVSPMVGSDRDAHNCIPSAGYTWCARENACVRPWELAKQKGFASSEKAFQSYCTANQ
ncbi:MAG: YbaY family lipoprotein [Methylococcales bacterium]|nr:YbaY family lipoprotein [Methylococcales bacterium]